jgi:hypothetical protein
LYWKISYGKISYWMISQPFGGAMPTTRSTPDPRSTRVPAGGFCYDDQAQVHAVLDPGAAAAGPQSGLQQVRLRVGDGLAHDVRDADVQGRRRRVGGARVRGRRGDQGRRRDGQREQCGTQWGTHHLPPPHVGVDGTSVGSATDVALTCG